MRHCRLAKSSRCTRFTTTNASTLQGWRVIFPADLTAEETHTIQDLARRAFRALKLRGYARIDFRMSPDGVFYCLEANTLPGMTALSLIPQAAATAGISFPELCDRIVRLAVETQGDP